jgi:superfamily II DNA or RNA helicase
MNTTRTKVIAATGAGKSLVQYQLLRDKFVEPGGALQCIVAPTLSLIAQHHVGFQSYGLFHEDGVVPLHFHTGPEHRGDAGGYGLEYVQTTDEGTFLEALERYQTEDRDVLVMVTYASLKKMVALVRGADTMVFDEFHHLVQQTQEQKQFLLDLPTDHAVFFSASEKRGPVVSSLKEELFGKKVIDVTYARLRDLGIVVPQIIVKVISVDPSSKRVKGLARDIKHAAELSKFDAESAVTEAAATIVARRDLIANEGRCNLLTFGKSVPACHAIVSTPAVKEECGGALVQAVSAATKQADRKVAFKHILESDDSILHQHSVCKEGIDITPFNGLIFSRRMDVIGTQQAIGRIVRAHPEDTRDIQAGQMDVTSPARRKPRAVVYLLQDSEDDADFAQFIKEFVEKLLEAGLTENDFQFQDIVEERNGKTADEQLWLHDVQKKFDFTAEHLNKVAKTLVIEQVNADDYDRRFVACEKLSALEKIKLLVQTKRRQV